MDIKALVELITNNGLSVCCVLYMIYFQNVTLQKILDTLGVMSTRLAKIETKIGIEESEEK